MRRNLWLLTVLAVLLQGCLTVTFHKSDKRPNMPQSISMPNGLKVTSAGLMSMSVNGTKSEFFPSSLLFETGTKVVYVDPAEFDIVKPADMIFITHSHEDHLSIADIKRLATKDTVIYCPKTVSPLLKDFPNVKEVKPGDTLSIGDIQCEVYPAYSLKPLLLWIYSHPKEDLNVSYVLTLSGVRVFFCGDTDFVSEMRSITNIYAAFVPITGMVTMDSEQAAEAVNYIKPAVAIPFHYTIGTNQVARFVQKVDKSIQVKIMQDE